MRYVVVAIIGAMLGTLLFQAAQRVPNMDYFVMDGGR